MLLRRFATPLCVAMLLAFAVASAAPAQTNPLGQVFRVALEDFADDNGNGLIDCYESARFRVTVFDDDAPAGVTVRGTVTVPSDTPARWSFTTGTVEVDRVLISHCDASRILGNSPGQLPVVDYVCTPSEPAVNHNYVFSFFIEGTYTGVNGGPIQIDATNDVASPVAFSTSAFVSESRTRGCAAPDLVLTKSDGGASSAPGGTVSYTLAVRNDGNASATSATLTEIVPSASTFNSGSSSPGWSCSPSSAAGSTCTLSLGAIAAGATASRTFAVTVDPATTATQLSNAAVVAALPSDNDPTNNTATDTTPLAPGSPDLRLTKTLASGSPDPGATLVYTLGVSNTGNRTAAPVTLTETVPAFTAFAPGASSPGWACSPSNAAGSSCTLALPSLAPGAAETRSFAVTLANPLPGSATGIANTACASTATPGDPAGNNCSTITTPTTGSPSLHVAKSDGAVSGAPGDVITYTITYSNDGRASAPATLLTETVPAHTTFNAQASSPGWSCSSPAAGSTCTLLHGALVAGGSGSKVFAVTVGSIAPGVTSTTNTVTIASSLSDIDPSDNTASDSTPLLPGNPDLALRKTLVAGTGDPGTTLVYTLAVSNSGNRDAAPVTLTETVPANTTFSPAQSDSAWSCSSPSAGSTCTLTLALLASGASAARDFAVTIVSPLPAGVSSLANTACASTTTPGDPGTQNCSTVTTPATGSPVLDLVKSLASGSGVPGGTLVYSLAVSNPGNQGAPAVRLEETVPDATTFSAASSSPGWICSPSTAAGSSCTLDVGDVAGAAAISRTFAVVVESPLPPQVQTISNTACARSGFLTACSTLDVPTDATALLAVAKTLRPGSFAPGSVFAYDITVQNTGNRAAADVTLEERVPEHTSFEASSSSPDWLCSPSTAAGSICRATIGALAGGGAAASRTFAVRLVSPLPAGVRVIANEACALMPSAPPVCDSVSTPPNASPILRIAKSLASATIAPGETVAYTLYIENVGNQDASGVAIVDQVPLYTRFVAEQSTAGWTCTPNAGAGSACSLSIGDLPVGDNASATFAVVLTDLPAGPAALTMTNTGCITDDSGLSACSSVSTPITAAPALNLAKLPPANPLAPGAVLVFTLTVTNQGTRAASGVSISETVPGHTVFNAAQSSPAWSCSATTPGSECVFAVGDLAPGASRTALFAVKADAVLPPSLVQIANAACATDASGETSCDDTASPLEAFAEAILADTLAVDHNGNGFPDEGDKLGYTLIVTNPSPHTLSDLSIMATLDPHLSLEAGSVATSSGTASEADDGRPIVTVAQLAPGATVTITFAGLVEHLPANLRALSSQGDVAGSNFATELTDDPDTSADDDPTVTPLSPGAPVPVDVPTLSDIALLLLVGLLAAVALSRPELRKAR